jgi:hypothetical protein
MVSHSNECVNRMGKMAGQCSCKAYGRLTPTMIKRLQQLKRPNQVEPPLCNQSRTDLALGDKGLIIFREVSYRPGFYITQLTLLGRDAVPADNYEYCGCGSLTHIHEAACVGCGRAKNWDHSELSPC